MERGVVERGHVLQLGASMEVLKAYTSRLRVEAQYLSATSTVLPESLTEFSIIYYTSSRRVPLLGLLEQVMAHTPRIASIPLEQLRTRQVKHLPPIPPRHHPLLSIRLLQSLHNAVLVTQHSKQPVLTCLSVMLSVHPPLPLQPQLILEEQQQVGTRHCSAREEVLRHPPAVEVIRRSLVRKDVHKQLATWDKGSAYLGG